MTELNDRRLSRPATADELERLPVGAQMRDRSGFWFVRTTAGIRSGLGDEWTCKAFSADRILNDGTLRVISVPTWSPEGRGGVGGPVGVVR